MSRVRFVALLLASLGSLAIASSKGGAATSDAPPLREAVSVGFEVVQTPESGGSAEWGSAGGRLHAGDESTQYMTAGEIDDDGRARRALCVGGVGSAADVPSTPNALNVWTVRSRLLGATMDSLRISVDWSREEARRPGELIRVAGDSRMLVLREGEPHTLDFLLAPDGDLTCGRNLRVDLVAKVLEDPQFAEALLDYDLWLIDEAPGEPTHKSHVVLGGRQGESAEFALEPLVWSLEGVALRNETAQVLARVGGTIRGRLREDGWVDLVLDAHRQIGVSSIDGNASGWVSDDGRKVLRVREGETLALGLPAAQGVHTMALDGSWTSTVGTRGMTPAPPTPTDAGAVTLTKETVTVDFRRHFAGHEMSLRLTARRAPR